MCSGLRAEEERRRRWDWGELRGESKSAEEFETGTRSASLAVSVTDGERLWVRRCGNVNIWAE
jgi:hypothetical protein